MLFILAHQSLACLDIELAYYRQPNNEETEAFKLAYGTRASKEYFRKAKIALFGFGDIIQKHYKDNYDTKVKLLLDQSLETVRQEQADGIEKVHKKHNKTIQEYEFLHYVMKMVCPKVLQ